MKYLTFFILLIPALALALGAEPVISPEIRIVEEPLISPASIEQYIGKESIKKHYDPVKAQSIAWAESHFNKDIKNASSTASGVYQFLNGTFHDYCINDYNLTNTMKNKNDVKIQVECALRILTASPQGEDHWWPSRSNWKKYKPTDLL